MAPSILGGTRRPRSRVSVLILACLLGGGVRVNGQTFTLEAPINTSDDAQSATLTPTPLPGMRVQTVYLEATASGVSPSTVPSSIHLPGCNTLVSQPFGPGFFLTTQHVCTDAGGQVGWLSGGLPTISLVSGPSADDIDIQVALTSSFGPFTSYVTEHAAFAHSQPIATMLDLTNTVNSGNPGAITIASANAFHHVLSAKRALDPFGIVGGSAPSTRPVNVRVYPWNPTFTFQAPASYRESTDTILLYVPHGVMYQQPRDILSAFSGPTIAHEYGHRIVFDLYSTSGAPLKIRMREGICDFFGYYVTGHTQIGLGVVPASRNLAALPRPQFNAWGPNEHQNGLVIGGALYRTLFRFRSNLTVARFDTIFRQALHTRPTDEPGFLAAMMAAATPPVETALIQASFAEFGVTTASAPLPRQVHAIAAGWAPNTSEAPRLFGFIETTGAVVFGVEGFPPSATSLWFTSNAPTSMLPSLYGGLFLDPSSLGTPQPFTLNAAGALGGTIPPSVSTGPTAVHVAVMTGSTGLMISNALFVHL